MPAAYRPEVDGLRAWAVLPVIAFHGSFPGFSGGFVGVDVFFVISGYLITGILVGDLEADRYSIARFYERRARRILPALFVVVAASTLAAHLILMPQPYMDYAASIFSVALFLSNILFISEIDYFAPSAEETPLLHTWSLAVEEQFYILFPLILWALWKLWKRPGLVWGVTAMTLASLAFSEWAWRAYPAETFYFLPSRAWELGAGAMCALLMRKSGAPSPGKPGALHQAAGLAGLLAIAVSVVWFDRSTPFPSLWAGLPVGGAVAVIVYATPGTLAARLLSLRWVVAIGLISYSAYLWHNPMFVYARILTEGDPSMWIMAVLAVLSLVLAWLSWKFVEGPFRHRPGQRLWLPRQWQVFAASLAGIAVIAGLGWIGYFSQGRAELWLRSATPMQQQTYALFEAARVEVWNLDDGGCRFNQPTVTDEAPGRLVDCQEQFGPGLAIIGDSHAINLADALIRAESAPFIYGVTQGNCRPDTPGPECGFEAFLDLVSEQPGLFSRVVFEIAGQHLMIGPGGRRTERLFGFYPPGTEMPAEDLTLLNDRFERNAAYLRAVSAYVPVVWLSPRIEPQLDDAHVMAKGCDYDFALRPGQQEIFDRMARAVETLVAGEAAITSLDQGALLDFTMPQDFITCEALDWRDGDHLSPTGLDWLAQRLAPYLVP